MKHQAARQLVEAYVGGWRDNNLSRIIALREYRRTELPFEWHVSGANP